MATTIKLKNGSGAPLAGDLAQGEPAFDLTNKRLYTEDSGGTVIEVGTTPTSLTTTGTVTFGSLSDGSITITAFVDEDNMASNSATLVPTQQSVKAYVDSQVTAQDLDFQGDSGGALSIDLDSETLTIAGGTGIDTTGATNTLTVAIDSTVTTLTGTQTLTNKTLTAPVISSISNTGTLTLPTSTDTLVGRATTDILTNKTLTSPVISSISNTGTLTLPTSTDVLVGRATTDTLTNKTLTSPVINTGVSGTAVLDDDTFATASATTLATSESIKAYVDAQVDTADQLSELSDVNITTPADGALLFYDTTTTKWIDNVVSGDITIADTGVAAISSGVIVNADVNASAAISVSKTALVDGTGLTLTGDTLSVDASQTQITAVGTIGTGTWQGTAIADAYVADNLTISGGTVDNTVIGGTTAAAGTFTTFTSTGIDDNAASTAITIDSSQDVTFTSDAIFPDSGKAIFGAGNDLQIYHSGSHSFIADAGTGDLYIGASNNIALMNAAFSENKLLATTDGALNLYYDGSQKLATTATGIDVTGDVNSDSVTTGTFTSTGIDDNATSTAITIDSSENVGIGATTVDSALHIEKATPRVTLQIAGNSGYNTIESGGVNELIFGRSGTEQMRIDSSGNLLVGTTNVANSATVPGHYILPSGLHTSTRDGGAIRILNRLTSDGDLMIFRKDNVGVGVIGTQNWGIGTASPSAKLHVIEATSTPAVKIKSGTSSNQNTHITMFNDNDGGTLALGVFGSSATTFGTITAADGFISSNQELALNSQNASGAIKFGVGTSVTERMRIDSSGRVGIGTSSPSAPLDVNGSIVSRASGGEGGQIDFKNPDNASNGLTIDVSTANIARIFQAENNSSMQIGQIVGTGGVVGFYTGTTERARLDASGNLLVGQTSGSSADAGHIFNPIGVAFHVRDGGVALVVDRLTSDGDITTFRKDGTTVGSIGNLTSSSLYINGNGSAVANLGFGGTSLIYPTVDNVADLGIATFRFDDIYATNATIQTSDANEKQDIEALSEAETRVALAAKGLLRKFRWKSAVEEKGDEARIHFGIVAQDLKAAFEAEGLDAGRYAMFIHSTWTDEETGEERSRMGVRYSELLAFIIAAI